MKVRLAGLCQESIVDGPGVRTAIYFQGCSHRCPGCHNPETHDPAGGSEVEIDRLIELVEKIKGIDGVTLSGGEPFEQPASAAALAAAFTKRDLNLVLYSGYTFEALINRATRDENVLSLLQAGILLVDGPYMQELRDTTLPYHGSSNQRIIDLPASLTMGRAVIWKPRMACCF